MNIVERVKNILLTPAKEWETIKAEPLSTNQIYSQYVAIMALIPFVSQFLERAVIGINLGYERVHFPIANTFGFALVGYILSLVGVYIGALIIDALAPSFGSKKDLNGSLKIAAFSPTAVWTVTIVTWIPGLWFIGLFGLYSLYLLYLGIKSIKEPAEDKLLGYFIVVILAMICIYAAISAIAGLFLLRRLTLFGIISGVQL
jgi:hypothetical protein